MISADEPPSSEIGRTKLHAWLKRRKAPTIEFAPVPPDTTTVLCSRDEDEDEDGGKGKTPVGARGVFPDRSASEPSGSRLVKGELDPDASMRRDGGKSKADSDAEDTHRERSSGPAVDTERLGVSGECRSSACLSMEGEVKKLGRVSSTSPRGDDGRGKGT
jgi:hypothetical protein